MDIDVVIPTYNRLWALKRSLPYYLKQEVVNLVVVVDDASNDGTKEWVKKYCDNEPRLKYVSHQTNRGCGAGRNTGSLFSEAPLIFLADDDMVLKPSDGLSILQKEMEKNKGDIIAPILNLPEKNLPVDIVFNPCAKNNNSLFNAILEFKSPRHLINDLNGDTFECFTLRALTLIKKDVIKKIQYNNNLGTTGFREETDFQLKAHEAGFKLLACPKVILVDFNRQFDNGGCSHSMNHFMYELEVCRNNWRFLVRHKRVLKNDLNVQYPIAMVQVLFVINHFWRRIPFISKLIPLLSIYQ